VAGPSHRGRRAPPAAEPRAAGTLVRDQPSGLALRAVSLDPANAHYRLTAARLLASEQRFDDALKQVQAAAELAENPDDSRQVAEVRAWIERRKGG
jgi:hypothetical protein